MRTSRGGHARQKRHTTCSEYFAQKCAGNEKCPLCICARRRDNLQATLCNKVQQQQYPHCSCSQQQQQRQELCLLTCSFNSSCTSSRSGKKGGKPASSVYTSTPNDHASAAVPATPVDRISGATNSGVPRRRRAGTRLATPKSPRRMLPSAASRTFAGFTSRCAMPSACTCASAEASCGSSVNECSSRPSSKKIQNTKYKI
jgi:hypothetical protein